MTIRRGERWCVMGKNGAGKTTLLKMVAGALAPDSGEVKLGASLKMGYFAQQALDVLDPDLTIEEQLQRDFPDESIGVLRNLAGAFQFSGDDIDKKIRALSGGEKTRLVMARMLLNPPNFLVLDEPTNHLDLFTKEMLIEALKDFDGTMLFVSHDRAFLRALSNRVVELGGESGVEKEPHLYPARTSSTSRAPATRRRACIRRRHMLRLQTRSTIREMRESLSQTVAQAFRPRALAIARTPPSENVAMCSAIRSSRHVRDHRLGLRSGRRPGAFSSARHCACTLITQRSTRGSVGRHPNQPGDDTRAGRPCAGGPPA